MNNLSWYLYGINIAASVGIMLSLGFLLSLLVMCVVSFAVFVEDYDKRSLKWWFGVALLGAILVLIPSKDTMYAIAASEMGEEVLTSETGQKAQKAVLAWIDSQLEEKKGKK